MNSPYKIKDYLDYLKKAIKKTISDEDILNLIDDDGVLNFEKLTSHEVIDSNSEIIYNLSNIKSANTLKIEGLNCPNLSIELTECSFYNIDIKNSTFYSVDVNFSNVNRIWISNSTLDTNIKYLKIWDIEGLETIYLSGLNLKLLSIQKLKSLKTFNLTGNKIDNFDFKYIEILAGGYFDLESCYVSIFEIHNCKINVDISFYFAPNVASKIYFGSYWKNVDWEKVTFICSESTFKSFKINCNGRIKMKDCGVLGKLTIEGTYDTVELSKFEFTNNTIGKGVVLGKHHIKDEFKIEGNRLENGRWKFNGFSLGENCKSDITKQSFKDATFQNCDFSNFDFQDTDIHLAEIIEPTWNEVDIANQKRIQFKSEKEKLNLPSLKKLKKQYSFFRKKFEGENNYVDASKFKISEALTRIKIEKPGRKLLLYLNKWLNLFGESIARPFYWWYCFLLLFTLLYLFYGYSFTELIDGKQVTKPIEYDFEFDFSRLYSTNCSDVKHFFQAMALSLKNIVPIKLESDYYLSIGPKFPVSQNLSMLQKLINIIIVGALITSMRNFFRK